jgi:hypothetical protein
MIETLDPAIEVQCLRVPVEGIAAHAVTEAYKRLIAAQDDLTTILEFVCTNRNVKREDVVGWDNEKGELLVRLRR